jgi:hypothetical protein
MGFNLLSFAGGVATAIEEKMDTAEKEAKTFAIASTKNMYEKYTKLQEENKIKAEEAASEMELIQSNYTNMAGGKTFSAEQLAELARSPNNRKFLVAAIKKGDVNFGNLDPDQMIKIATGNPPDIARTNLGQALTLDTTLKAKIAEQSTKKQMGFFDQIGESAGRAAAEKTALALGTTTEQMQKALNEKAPVSTASFDFAGLRKIKTTDEQFNEAASAVTAAVVSGDQTKINETTKKFDVIAEQKLAQEKRLNGEDYAKQLLQEKAKTVLVLNNPSKFSPEEVKQAKRFQQAELNRAREHALAIKVSEKPEDTDKNIASLLGLVIKSTKDDVTFKRGDSEVVQNPVEGGPPIRAESPEGIRIIKEAQSRRAKETLLLSGSLNADGSVKTAKAAQWLFASGVNTYQEGGKLFVGSKSKQSTAAAPDQTLVTAARKMLEAKQDISTLNLTPEELKLVTQPPPVTPTQQAAPASGFTTKPLSTIEKIDAEKTAAIMPMVQQFKKAELDYLTAAKAGRQSDLSALMQAKEDLRKKVKDSVVSSFGEQRTPKILSTFGM